MIALGLAVLLTLECFQERGVQIRAALEKKSGFVQWLTVTALLLAVLLLGVFRAGISRRALSIRSSEAVIE